MDAINNGIINGSIDHGSRFKLPGPTNRQGTRDSSAFRCNSSACSCRRTCGEEICPTFSNRLSKDVSIMSFPHSAFRNLKWSFCLKPLFRRPIRFLNAFEKRSFPFQSLASSKLTKNAKVAATYNNSGPSVYLDALEIRNSPGQSISVFFLCHPLLCPSARPRRMHYLSRICYQWWQSIQKAQ